MRLLTRILKIIGALIATFVVFVVVVANFGTVNTRLTCPGEYVQTSPQGQSRNAATLYARVEDYRWFIFWADHDAIIFWEIPPGDAVFGYAGFGYYSDSSFATPITDFGGTKQYGSWSSTSKRVYVERVSENFAETFDGICQ